MLSFASAVVAIIAAAVANASPMPQFEGLLDSTCLYPVFTGTPPYVQAITPGAAYGLRVDDSNSQVSGSPAILDSNDPSGRLFFENGTIGTYLGHCSPFYLNIGDSNNSYKPLTWSYEKVEGIWDAEFSSVVEATATSTYSATEWFLACQFEGSSSMTLYLQTGFEQPLEAVCTMTKLQVSANTLHEVGTD